MEHMSDEQLEKLRRKAKIGFILMLVFTLLFFVVLVVKSSSIDEEAALWENVLISGFFSLWAFYLFYLLFFRRASQKFSRAFKEKYVLSVLEESGRFEGLAYDPKKGFSYDDIRSAAVVDCGERNCFVSEDMLSGRYKGVSFRFSDVTTQKVVSRQRKLEKELIFQGQVICLERFDSRKVSDGHLQIFQKETLSNIWGWIAEHPIETENVSFNEKFHVFATDEHNAFYILTPALLEKIEDFSQAVKQAVGAQVAITFQGENMFVAINDWGNLFDPYIDQPVAQQREKILKDMEFLEKAVDILLSVE